MMSKPIGKQTILWIGYFVAIIVVVALAGLVIDVIAAERHPQVAASVTPGPPPPREQPAGQEFADGAAHLFNPEFATLDRAVQQIDGSQIELSITEQGAQDIDSLAANINHALSADCIPNLSLAFPSNLRFDLWGFCSQSPDVEALVSLINFAQDAGVSAISLEHYVMDNELSVARYMWDMTDATKFRQVYDTIVADRFDRYPSLTWVDYAVLNREGVDAEPIFGTLTMTGLTISPRP